VPRKAVSSGTENSADVCRAFFGAISAYMLVSHPPQVTSINAQRAECFCSVIAAWEIFTL
jgi:hypothetical protein